ncbi:copper-binding protein [Mesorhizobium sp. YC-39]|uniref:copper-binding protein n=1 Tax=unclassified Mesorhizobium TaxID=325217 RepID=UPI0021E73496|nr:MULTISPECIES: copper-binding protein [unclassified Mesorhizobium]MCV3208353.1 copper-binding protein [Mesorhizobium sp. YC-2]MCV3232297.1 copper-binding protein [Mesorhizobium sp. YC-39]
MTLFVKAISTLVLVFAIGGSALAQEYVKGEVLKVDAKQKKLTIKHEPLTNLDMPAMTMVFVVAEDGMLKKVKSGQAIEFTADRVNGRITVTGIK